MLLPSHGITDGRLAWSRPGLAKRPEVPGQQQGPKESGLCHGIYQGMTSSRLDAATSEDWLLLQVTPTQKDAEIEGCTLAVV